METMSRYLLSSAPLRCGKNASLLQTRCRSCLTFNLSCRPFLTKGSYYKHEVAVPFLLQTRANALPSHGVEKPTSGNNAVLQVHEAEGVKNISEEIHVKVVGMHLAAVVSIAVACSVAFIDVGSAIARSGEVDLPPTEPEVATISSSKEINLAKQLKAIGAKMYGAFWCSHCFEQKQMFGKEALKYIEYVECYPEGYRRGVKLAAACSAANIQGFPTWVINGQQYSGEQEFDKLAELSGLSVRK